MSINRSPRVNKSLMLKYSGQTVRLIAKMVSIQDDTAIVETSDGGQIEVKLLRNYNLGSTYIEVIGQVLDERTIKMVGCVSLGDNVDMKLADKVVQIWHDPRFAQVF